MNRRLRAIGVRKNLGSIVQKNAFVDDDVRTTEEDGGEGPEEEEGEGDMDGEEGGSGEGDALT